MNQPNLWEILSSVNLPSKTVEKSKNFKIETILPKLSLKNLKSVKESQLAKVKERKTEIDGKYLK